MRTTLRPPIALLALTFLYGFSGCTSASLERSVAINGAGPEESTGEAATAEPELIALDEPTINFLRDAIYARRFAIEAMRIAAERGATEDIRNFARHGLGQQELILSRLDALAQKYGVTVAPGLRDRGIELMGKLQSATGPDFDNQFLEMLIRERERAVLRHQFAAEQANADVRMFGVQFRDAFQAQVEELQALRARLRERGP